MSNAKSLNPIKIIYEDNHLIVVEKPVNILSQKDESNDIDMLTLVKRDIKQRFNKPGDVFLGLVHRIDRPVGGIMVFAKTSKAASRLSEQIRTRKFQKIYMAVVHGKFDNIEGELIHYLLKDSKTNTVYSVDRNVIGAKEAVLNYKVVDYIEELSFVKIYLHTGRSHQIRVQFSNIKHPLYGDQRYGVEINRHGQQIALWSTSLTFKHPTRYEIMQFECKPPNISPWNLFDWTTK